MKPDEKALRRIAEEYLRKYSGELRRELDALDQTRAMPTPELDRRVHERVAKIKRARRRKLLGGLAAACIVLALLTPAVWQRYSQSQLSPPETSQQPTQSSGGAQPSEGAPSEAAPPASAVQPEPNYEILPLAFTLPEQFSVASVEQDIKKTVYTLDDTMLDPVVMTLEQSGDTAFFDSLTPITVEGHEAFGRSGDGYSLIAFEKQDILYVLTCEHDINTLTGLSRNILV